MKPFIYFAPHSVSELISLLRDNPSGKILAGGTDLLLQMKAGQKTPDMLIDIKHIAEFRSFGYGGKTDMSIWPATTVRELELSPVFWTHYTALAQGASVIGSVQIRNRATLAGNICNASPSADLAPGLLALGASVRTAGIQKRTVAIEEFFVGPGKTILEPGEFLASVQIPQPQHRTGSAYARHTMREAMDIAIVGVGVGITLKGQGTLCEDAKVALGAVAPTPVRAYRAEAILQGQYITQDVIDVAARVASEEAQPIRDVRASADYRRHMVRVLTQRVIGAAFEQAQQGKRKGRLVA